jgi:hypothetical protein
MKRKELKEIVTSIVKEILNEEMDDKQKIKLEIDPNNKDTFVVKYLDKPVGSLTAENGIDRGDDAYGTYSSINDANQIYVFKSSDDRFKRFDNAKSSLKKHVVDFNRLVTIRLEKGFTN